MGNMRKEGASSYVWNDDHKTDDELLTELWDEAIDFTLVLQAISNSDNLGFSRLMATLVLLKHGKRTTSE